MTIIERLRWPTPALKEHAKIAADLIESQAKRIKELEAKCDYWRDHYKALLQKIEDAPVVAEVQRERGLTYGNRAALPVGSTLIRKEDLLK